MAVFSAFYMAQKQSTDHRAYIPLPWFVKIRLLSSVMLLATAVVSVVGTRILDKISVSSADILTSCIIAFSWLLHCIYVHRLKDLSWTSWRGATPMVVIFLLPVISVSVQLHTTIVQRLNHSPIHSDVEEYCIYVSTFLTFTYFMTLIPGSERVSLLDEDAYYRAINEDVTERSSLLSGSSTDYRSISRARAESVVAENNVNCLSFLTFHWVHGLLTKGAKKSLSGAQDLYLLPKRLGTSALFIKFTSILTGKFDYTLRKSSSHLSDSSLNSSLNSSTNSIPEVVFTTHGREDNDGQVKKPLTLFKALNKAFGFEYYSLGILKLLADCFGFAGPILLNLLISYMERKTEPEQNGYWYAAGLFVATLLGSICSTQFDYNCSIVGYKIRTAIITTIYRKSLSVSNVCVGKFTSGQITNFMSTDTDRIVNFCPSFHAFWSLPFQIGVSLYLLHQQVMYC